jgi:hypothetical protein
MRKSIRCKGTRFSRVVLQEELLKRGRKFYESMLFFIKFKGRKYTLTKFLAFCARTINIFKLICWFYLLTFRKLRLYFDICKKLC